MPVTVECPLKRSKFLWLAMAAPVCLMAALFSYWQWWSFLPFVLLLLLINPVIDGQFSPHYVRVQGDQITTWVDEETLVWQWQGEGRLSHAFVQFNLINAASEPYQLRIWKDSVSDASWRALNMVFRVNQSFARQQAEP